MFTKEELLLILQRTDNDIIKEKINACLYCNENLVEDIVSRYINDGLLKVEKNDSCNEYYVHMIDSERTYTILGELTDLSFKHKTNHTYPELHLIQHNNIESMWWHKDMMQSWTNREVDLYWVEDRSCINCSSCSSYNNSLICTLNISRGSFRDSINIVKENGYCDEWNGVYRKQNN